MVLTELLVMFRIYRIIKDNEIHEFRFLLAHLL